MSPMEDTVKSLRRMSTALASENDLTISIDSQLKIPVAQTADGICLIGTMAISHHLAMSSESKADTAVELNDIERAAVLQWIEYRMNRIDERSRTDRQETLKILKELNFHLRRRSYLIGSKWTAADLLVWLGLHGTLSQMTMLDRESYPQLGRWFDQVQRISTGSEDQRLPWIPKLVFSKTPL